MFLLRSKSRRHLSFLKSRKRNISRRQFSINRLGVMFLVKFTGKMFLA